MKIKSSYLEPVFNPEKFQSIVNNTIIKAREIHTLHKYDTIAFTGVSGAAMTFTLCHNLNIPLLCVRKNSITSHYTFSGNLEGNLDVSNYLIVDDFIQSGATVQSIIKEIRNHKRSAKCVAMLMYSLKIDDKFFSKDLQASIPIFGSMPEI